MSSAAMIRNLDELALTRHLPVPAVPPALGQTVAELRAKAADAGVPITYFALAPLPAEPQLVQGTSSAWALSPAGTDPTRRAGRLPIPHPERARLRRLVDAGINFPATVVAHEVSVERARELAPSGAEAFLTTRQLADLVGPVPPAAEVNALSDRLGRATAKIARAARHTLTTTVAAPLAAAAALTDPAVFGILTPSGMANPGEPGLWFLLASWCW